MGLRLFSPKPETGGCTGSIFCRLIRWDLRHFKSTHKSYELKTQLWPGISRAWLWDWNSLAVASLPKSPPKGCTGSIFCRLIRRDLRHFKSTPKSYELKTQLCSEIAKAEYYEFAIKDVPFSQSPWLRWLCRFHFLSLERVADLRAFQKWTKILFTN